MTCVWLARGASCRRPCNFWERLPRLTLLIFIDHCDDSSRDLPLVKRWITQRSDILPGRLPYDVDVCREELKGFLKVEKYAGQHENTRVAITLYDLGIVPYVLRSVNLQGDQVVVLVDFTLLSIPGYHVHCYSDHWKLMGLISRIRPPDQHSGTIMMNSILLFCSRPIWFGFVPLLPVSIHPMSCTCCSHIWLYGYVHAWTHGSND